MVPLNHFVADTDAEVAYVKERCEKMGATFAVAKVWADGGEGGKALAEKVLETLETKESNFHVLYEDNLSIEEKINKVCKEIYGAGHVSFTAAAKKTLAQIGKLGFEHFPVCIAKTQYSLSDDPKVLGRPEGFEVTVKEIRISAGAGFIVALLGDVMTMPGLPKKPCLLYTSSARSPVKWGSLVRSLGDFSRDFWGSAAYFCRYWSSFTASGCLCQKSGNGLWCVPLAAPCSC